MSYRNWPQTPVGHTSIHSFPSPLHSLNIQICFPGICARLQDSRVTERPGFVLRCSRNGASDIRSPSHFHSKASTTPGVLSTSSILPHCPSPSNQNRTGEQKKDCWLSPLQPAQGQLVFSLALQQQRAELSESIQRVTARRISSTHCVALKNTRSKIRLA